MKNFIDNCKYKSEIKEAIAYEQELAYFIQTHLSSKQYTSSDSSIDNMWNESNPFINWIKGWMRKENFASYLKFLRHPLPTASLVQDDIVPELKKVFDSTNSYHDYVFSSAAIKQNGIELVSEYNDYYKNVIFKHLVNNHNSILITDYIDKRKPYRYVIKIDSVLAIESTTEGNIKGIAFKGVNSAGEERYFYYTDQFYSVYIKKGEAYEEDYKNLHEIGKCPADFISVNPLNAKSFVIRKSIFSNSLEKFENYVNYYTLQKMSLPHGAIPVITHYKKNNKECGTKFEDGTTCVKGYISGNNGILGNKDNLVQCPVCNSKTIIQAGTVIGLPVPKIGDNGEKPIDLNANFVKFHYIPTDILKWWNEFVSEKASEIKYQLVGKGFEDSNGQAKNSDQIARGNQTLENTLIELSSDLSILRSSIDYKFLKASFGKSFISVTSDMGTDFYLETEFELRDSLSKAVDPIDKKSLIDRINYTVYKNNPEQLDRNKYMYKLLPYSTITDVEFIKLTGVDPKQRELRLNFLYYIDKFEAQYGDLNVFFDQYFGESVTEDKKLQTANLIINKYIKDYEGLQDEANNGKGDPIQQGREIEESSDMSEVHS